MLPVPSYAPISVLIDVYASEPVGFGAATVPAAPSTLINTLLGESLASLVVNLILAVSVPISNLSPSDVLDNAFAIAAAVSAPVALAALSVLVAVPNSLPSLSVNLFVLPSYDTVTDVVVALLFLSNTVIEYVMLFPDASSPTSADVLT